MGASAPNSAMEMPPPGDKLPDRVYASLLRAIRSGEFPAGRKLPTEHQLARRFEVSRPTVRQAIARLRTDGVVTSRRGAGSFVIRVPGVASSTQTTIESIADIDRYFAFRLCVEAGAAEQAAEMRTEDDLRAIHQSQADLIETIGSGGSGVEEDLKFHLAIANASHNQFFIRAIEEIVRPIRQCLELATTLSARKTAEQIRRLQDEHGSVVDAIHRGSSIDAAAAMRQHIVHARRRVFQGRDD
jgi:GntR family transcriptional repressor for pyruvate dehydrogenase complex